MTIKRCKINGQVSNSRPQNRKHAYLQKVQGAQLKSCSKVQNVQLPQFEGKARAQEGRKGRKVGLTPSIDSFFLIIFFFIFFQT
jgi:hypothetical protein